MFAAQRLDRGAKRSRGRGTIAARELDRRIAEADAAMSTIARKFLAKMGQELTNRAARIFDQCCDLPRPCDVIAFARFKSFDERAGQLLEIIRTLLASIALAQPGHFEDEVPLLFEISERFHESIARAPQPRRGVLKIDPKPGLR